MTSFKPGLSASSTAIVFLALGVWGTPAARAAEPTARVLLVSLRTCCPEITWPRAERAVKDEIAAAGLRVMVEQGASGEEGARRRELKRRARSRDAHFAICIARTSEGSSTADLWVFDALTDKTLLRQLPLGREEGGESADITGLRVVEIMRASLLELKLKKIGGRAHAKPEPAERLVKDLEVRRKRGFKRLSLALGPIGWGSTGGAGFVFGVGLEARFRPWSILSFAVDGAVSLASSELSGPEGSADFNLLLYRLWVYFHLPVKFRIKPVLGLGVGRATAWASGTAEKPYDPSSVQTSVTYLGGSAQLDLELVEHLYLFVGLRVGLLTPPLSIKFDEREVASFGAPLFGGQLGLQLRLF